MNEKELKANAEKQENSVEEVVFTEEQNKTQMRMFENDFISGLIAAADFRTDETQRVEIIRNGKLYFAFDIRPLSEYEYDKCKKKHTKYVRNKQLGLKMPEDTNTAKYRCALIYEATVKADRDKLWDNKKVWETLNEKNLQTMNGLDVIENTLLSGEKDRIIDAIDKLSGYDVNNLEEITKN